MLMADEWFKDIPQQFLGKKNIDVLIKAFVRQLQELKQVFDDMNTKLDLDVATGQNLDYVGTIIPLSRKEAGLLVGINLAISDELYRSLMKFKVLSNSSECTYADLMNGMNYVFGTDRLHYREDERYPATIFFDVDRMPVDDVDIEFHRWLCIKPAGVRLLVNKNLSDSFSVKVTELIHSITFHSGWYPRANMPYLLYQGKARYDGVYKYSGYMTDKQIDLYPTGINIVSGSTPLTFFAGKLAVVDRLINETKYVEKAKAYSNTVGEPAYGMSLKSGSVIRASPKYVTVLTTYRHISRYNGTHRYDGQIKYDAKIIKEDL